MRRFLRVLLVAVFGAAVGLGARRVFHGKAAPVAAVPRVEAARPSEPVKAAEAREGGEKAAGGVSVANPVFESGLTVAGYVARGNRVNVLMSDGTVITEADKSLETVRRNGVVIAGRHYALVEPAPSPVVPQTVVAAPPVASSPVVASPVAPVPADDGITRIPQLPPLDFTPHLGLPSPFEHRGP